MTNVKIKTIRQMAEQDLKIIFKDHISEENKISRSALFYKVYKVQMSKMNKLKASLMWSTILKACAYCRKKTRCMIISDYYKFDDNKAHSGAYYYVASKTEEAMKYSNKLGKIAKGMNKAGKNMVSNVKKGYHKKPSMW